MTTRSLGDMCVLYYKNHGVSRARLSAPTRFLGDVNARTIQSSMPRTNAIHPSSRQRFRYIWSGLHTVSRLAAHPSAIAILSLVVSTWVAWYIPRSLAEQERLRIETQRRIDRGVALMADIAATDDRDFDVVLFVAERAIQRLANETRVEVLQGLDPKVELSSSQRLAKAATEAFRARAPEWNLEISMGMEVRRRQLERAGRWTKRLRVDVRALHALSPDDLTELEGLLTDYESTLLPQSAETELLKVLEKGFNEKVFDDWAEATYRGVGKREACTVLILGLLQSAGVIDVIWTPSPWPQ